MGSIRFGEKGRGNGTGKWKVKGAVERARRRVEGREERRGKGRRGELEEAPMRS